jgi:hypothetical protein
VLRFAGLALRRAEQVDVLEPQEVGLFAADVGRQHRHARPQRRQHAVEQPRGDHAVAEVGEDPAAAPSAASRMRSARRAACCESGGVGEPRSTLKSFV